MLATLRCKLLAPREKLGALALSVRWAHPWRRALRRPRVESFRRSRRKCTAGMPRAKKGSVGMPRAKKMLKPEPAPQTEREPEPEPEPGPMPESEPEPEPEPEALSPILASRRARVHPVEVRSKLEDLLVSVEAEVSGQRARDFEAEAWRIAIAAEAVSARVELVPRKEWSIEPQSVFDLFHEYLADLKYFFPDRMYKRCKGCAELMIHCHCFQKCPCGGDHYAPLRPWNGGFHCDRQWRSVRCIGDFITDKPVPATIHSGDLEYMAEHGHPYGDENGPRSPGLIAHR